MPSFRTKAGRSIPIVAGYRQLFPRFYWNSPEVTKEQQEPQQTYSLFLNHVYKYAAVLDLLESVGLPTRYQSGLDIGAMDGTLSRLFSLEHRLQTADAVDVADFTAKLSDETFRAHVERFIKETARAQTLPNRMSLLETVPLYKEMRYVPPKGSLFWELKATGPARYTSFVQTDVTTFQPQAPYDLVTAFLTLVIVDLDSIFSKISDLLAEGGTFVMIEPYWWYPYLFFGVAGEFPWAFQRLDDDDLDTYIREHHAEDADFLRERLKIFSNRHTVDSYIAAANRNHLDLIGVRRFVQTEAIGSFRAKLSPQYMGQFPDARIEDAIADIREFRQDVQAIDLMTSYVSLVFRKRGSTHGSLSEAIMQQK